jgi:hypothetical protein
MRWFSGREIERELAAPADARCVVPIMLARRGRLEIHEAQGDGTKLNGD